MTENIEIGGTEYEVNGNPSLGTVRIVQSMQMSLLREHIDEEELAGMDSMEEEDIVSAIIDSGGYDALDKVQWEKSLMEPVQTISLACDHDFDADDFDEVPALDFEEMRETCEDVLGGDANDFFSRLGIGISLSEDEIQRAKAMQQ